MGFGGMVRNGEFSTPLRGGGGWGMWGGGIGLEKGKNNWEKGEDCGAGEGKLWERGRKKVGKGGKKLEKG